MSWLASIWFWVTEHATVLSAAVSAVATTIVSWFTVVLARVGRDADRNFRAVERAFVFLNDIPEVTFRNEAKIPTTFLYSPFWENSGTTPTKSMTVRLNWTASYYGDLPDDFPYSYSGTPEVMFLGPKSRMPSSPIRIPANVIEDAGKNTHRIYIWGRVDYEDIFGVPHYTQFCYRLNVEPALQDPYGWRHRTYYGSYNRTDESDRT